MQNKVTELPVEKAWITINSKSVLHSNQDVIDHFRKVYVKKGEFLNEMTVFGMINVDSTSKKVDIPSGEIMIPYSLLQEIKYDTDPRLKIVMDDRRWERIYAVSVVHKKGNTFAEEIDQLKNARGMFISSSN